MHAFGAIPVAVSKAPTSLSTSSSLVSSAGATYTSSERHSDSQDKRRTPSPSRSAQANSRAKSHFHSSPLRPQEDSMAYTTPVMTTPSTSSKREKLEVKTAAEPISRQSSSSSKKSSGSGSAPSTPRTKHEYPGDVLWDVLGESVKPRRSRCTPEFLEEIAKHRGSSIVTNGGDSGVSLQNPELAGTTKLIAGVEAVDIYRKFVAGTSIHDILTTLPLPSLKKALGSAKEEPKVVFGVAAVTSSHKHVVEYFRTWKGHDSTLSKEESRNLDIAFKRVRRALDAEFKRASIYGNFTPPSPTHSNPSLGASPGPKRPTTLDVPAHDANVDPPTKSLPRPPLSATDSVMSLPFLNMIRGVPLGNRVPLRVTNPDRLSMVSGTSSLPSPPITPETPTFTQHVSAKEASENAENIAPQPLQSRYQPRYASTIDTATLTRQGTHSTKRDPEDYNLEFVVVLLEEKIEKSGRTWHGLERQTSARPSHALSRRVSPWDGPLVRDSGITYSTAPRPRPLANVSEPNHSPSSKAKSFKRNHSTPLSGHHLALPLLHSKSGSASSSRSNLNKSKHHHHHHGTAPTADESSSDESDDEPEVLGWQKPVVPSTAFMLAATAAIAAGSSSSMSSGTTDSSYGNTPASGMGVPLPSMHGMSMSAHAMSPPPGVAPVIPPGYGTVAVARNPSVASHYSHMHATNGMPLSRSASVGYATPYTQLMMMTPAMGAHMMMVPSRAASTASGYHRHPGY